jgi:hypothetical protein
MFHLEEKTLKFFIFVRFHHVVGRLLFFHKVLGLKGLKKGKDSG